MQCLSPLTALPPLSRFPLALASFRGSGDTLQPKTMTAFLREHGGPAQVVGYQEMNEITLSPHLLQFYGSLYLIIISFSVF